MKDDLEKTKRRTLRYWYVDGLSEIFLGLLCLLLGGYFWLQLQLPSNSWLSQLLIVFLMLLVMGSGLLLRKAVGAIKNRLTYPRTGYVAYLQPRRKQNWLAGLLALGIGALTVILIDRLPGTTIWMPGVTGIIFSIVVLVIGLRLGLVRFYLQGVFFLLLGCGLSLAGVGDINGLRFFYIGSGVVLLLSGLWVLLAYLRQTSASLEEPNAG